MALRCIQNWEIYSKIFVNYSKLFGKKHREAENPKKKPLEKPQTENGPTDPKINGHKFSGKSSKLRELLELLRKLPTVGID